MPKRTFKDTMTLGRGNDQIDLHYFGRGHTNGDAFVVFPALRVMHAGDIFSGKNVPLLDAVNGGSGVEIGKTLAKAAETKNVDQIITGHSTVMTVADLKEYAAFNNEFAAAVQAAKKAGKTPDEVAIDLEDSSQVHRLRGASGRTAAGQRAGRVGRNEVGACGWTRHTTRECADSLTLAVVMILGGVVAQGHHSIAAAYDRARPVKLDAVVVEFAMVQPHPFVVVEVRNGGSAVRWRGELDNRHELIAIGMTADTLKPGDRVIAQWQRRSNAATVSLRVPARSAFRWVLVRAGRHEPAAVGRSSSRGLKPPLYRSVAAS